LIPVCYVSVAVGGQENSADTDSWEPSIIFDSSFAEKPTLHNIKDPMKLFLVHTMVFVGTIWKNKSVDSCLFCQYGCWWPRKLC
jgi:hypothetical protein